MNALPGKLLPLLLLSLPLFGGCAKNPVTARPTTTPNPSPQAAADPMVRVQTLERLSDEFARTSNALPGSDLRAHRKLMAQALAQLEQILTVLEGPHPGAEFRSQLHVIRDAESELASGPQDLSPEPAIDSGLRAARDVLWSISQGGSYDRATVTTLFDRLTTAIDRLDTVRGPLHQVVAGDAVGIMSQIVGKMADAMGQRLAQENASTAPATQGTAAGGMP